MASVVSTLSSLPDVHDVLCYLSNAHPFCRWQVLYTLVSEVLAPPMKTEVDHVICFA